jgi:beta-glucanase (GH16 family)
MVKYIQFCTISNSETMSISRIAILMMVIVNSSLVSQLNAQRPVPEGFIVILSDDFDDELNADYWTKGLWGANDAHLFPNYNNGGGFNRINANFAGYVLDSNTVINDGYLELHNVKETINGTDPNLTLDFTNAMINTLGKVTFNGSVNEIRIKMRAKFPTGSDVWPSVWMVAQYDWPPEIDVFEYFGQWFQWGNTDLMKLSWIYGQNFNKEGEISWKYLNFDSHFNADEFNVYEFIWSDSFMQTSVNGEVYSTLTRGAPGEYGIPDDIYPDGSSDYSLIVQNGRMSAVVEQYGLANSQSNVFVIDYIDIYEKDPNYTSLEQENVNDEYFSIAPNPITEDSFTVFFNQEINKGTIQIYNLKGQLLKSCNLNGTYQLSLDVPDFEHGIYFVKVSCNGRTYVQKVLVM